MEHPAVAIVPTSDLDSSEAFYRRLKFTVVSDYGHYRILEDGRGSHLHLTYAEGWPRHVEDNPFGLYLYVEDVDANGGCRSGVDYRKGCPTRQALGQL